MYAEVLNVGTGQWQVGKIENHTARPLSLDEVQEVCRILNAKPALDAHLLKAIAGKLSEEARYVFSGEDPWDTPQAVLDVIEWFDAKLKSMA